jgi:cytochrome bd-type quinol oxidase subunit 2
MKKLIQQLSVSFAAAALLAVAGMSLVAVPVNAAGTNERVCEGVNLVSGSSDKTCNEDGTNTFASLAKRIVNIFSLVVGVVSVVMIIIGGFRYIVSNGDSNAVTGAKNSILYAVVGLVIVLFAQVIVRFVLTEATKTT